jgi:hypothetical protein
LFVIQAPENDLLKTNHKVVDPETGTTLKLISMTQRSGGYAFILQRGDVAIPFEMSRESGIDEKTGKEYMLTRFMTFGVSFLIESRTGIQAHRFQDSEDEHDWKRLAAEAVLIFGGCTTGHLPTQSGIGWNLTARF